MAMFVLWIEVKYESYEGQGDAPAKTEGLLKHVYTYTTTQSYCLSVSVCEWISQLEHFEYREIYKPGHFRYFERSPNWGELSMSRYCAYNAVIKKILSSKNYIYFSEDLINH